MPNFAPKKYSSLHKIFSSNSCSQHTQLWAFYVPQRGANFRRKCLDSIHPTRWLIQNWIINPANLAQLLYNICGSNQRDYERKIQTFYDFNGPPKLNLFQNGVRFKQIICSYWAAQRSCLRESTEIIVLQGPLSSMLIKCAAPAPAKHGRLRLPEY